MSKYCISIDASLCSGFGACADLAPALRDENRPAS